MDAKALAALDGSAFPVRRLRWHAVGLALAGVAGLTLLGGTLLGWFLQAADDPFESAPELRPAVFDYVMMPTIGRTYRAGDVEAVLLAVTRLEDGGVSLHFVLDAEGRLGKAHTRLVAAGGVGSATCAASGRSGWGECYVAVPASLGSRFDLELYQRGRLEGSFPVDLSGLH